MTVLCKHTFHAVAVSAVTRRAEQIPGKLHVRIAAARRLEAVVARGEALRKLSVTGLAEKLIRSPAAGREALLLQHGKAALRGF